MVALLSAREPITFVLDFFFVLCARRLPRLNALDDGHRPLRRGGDVLCCVVRSWVQRPTETEWSGWGSLA